MILLLLNFKKEDKFFHLIFHLIFFRQMYEFILKKVSLKPENDLFAIDLGEG